MGEITGARAQEIVTEFIASLPDNDSNNVTLTTKKMAREVFKRFWAWILNEEVSKP